MVLPSIRMLEVVLPWIKTRIPEPELDPEPGTAGLPIVFPWMTALMLPPVDVDDEKTLIACNGFALSMFRLLTKWNVRFELVSWVKLAWMPLSLKLFPETVKSVMVAVSCVWTSRARCGELLTKFELLIVAAVVTDVPDASNRKAFAPVTSLTLLKELPVTFIAVSAPTVLRM